MKWRKWLSSLVVLALVVTLWPVSAASAGNTVNIPDPAFLAYLNSELDKNRPSNTPITQEEMATFTSINTRWTTEKITSIKGISAAVNLETLTTYGDITGLEEIASLKNLTSLTVTNNKYVEDLSFLGEKPHLTSLDVEYVPNMTTLQGLTSQNCPSLATLNLSDNTNLVDISALGNVAFPHLTKLDLGDSPAIPSISALHGYTSLTYLDLEKVKITAENRADYRSTVASLTSLTQLHMPYCKITDADAQAMFAPLSQLKTLVLNINELTNVDFLDHMSADLTTLGLNGNDVTDLSKVKKFQNLVILGFGSTLVTDFRFVSALPDLAPGGVRHSEGTESFPASFEFYAGSYQDPVDTVDGTLTFRNPYIQPDGKPVPIVDPVITEPSDLGYTISYDETTNEITLKNFDGIARFYVNYQMPLSNGEFKVCRLFINAYAKHAHTWSAPTYTWAEDSSSCTASRVCENNAAHVETAKAVITHEQTKAPTCTQAGETTYTATFSEDWAAAQTKTLSDVPSTGHQWAETTYSWAEDGSACTASRVCENDAAHVETATAVITKEQIKAPTCTQAGQTTYTATFSEDWAVTQTKTLTDVPSTGHQWAETTYSWAEDGSACTASRVCETDATHVETVTAAIAKEQTKAPTCTQMGETTYTATFTQDWAVSQTKTLANVEPIGHQWAETTYTWAEDGSACTASRVCENDATHVETATAVITQEQTKAPTCTQAGETTYTATFSEDWAATQTKTLANVEPIGHQWAETTYSWTEDGSACTASRVCENDATHVETVTAAIAKEQTKAPTCTQMGETTYTATFTQDWAVSQTKTLADVAMLPHSYNQAWQWDDANHFHLCERCGDKADVAAHSFQWITDTQAGEKYQKCSVCGYQLAAEPLPTSTPAPSATPNPVPSATPDPSQPPQTGDTSSVLLWISALAICSILLPALMAWKRNAK